MKEVLIILFLTTSLKFFKIYCILFYYRGKNVRWLAYKKSKFDKETYISYTYKSSNKKLRQYISVEKYILLNFMSMNCLVYEFLCL